MAVRDGRRIFGPLMESLRSPGQDGKPHAGSHAHIRARDSQAAYRLRPASVRPICHPFVSLGAVRGEKDFASTSRGRRRLAEISFLGPDAPDDASEFVSQGNGRLVEPPGVANLAGPGQ